MDHFAELTPDRFLPAIEEALGVSLTALARSLPSYINRVYEVQSTEGESFVAKFYRPGRWSKEGLLEEHAFLADCAEVDIPVVCPCGMTTGGTLGWIDDVPFCVFPKRAGRQFDVESDQSWERVGMLLGRLHNAGAKRDAPTRQRLDPAASTQAYVRQLTQEAVTTKWQQPFEDICTRIIDTVSPGFENVETLRIHGDFHVGNILERPDEGLVVIDFDDMMVGPAVQDFWLLLPERYPACDRQLQMMLGGYRRFREVDSRSLLLIEGLRAMRMIYFTAWCAMQREDFRFQSQFPEWGSDRFWGREVQDLREQYSNIMESMEF